MDLFRLLGDIFDDIVMLIAAIGIVLLTILIVIRRTRPKPDRNPFSLDFLRDREPLVTDHAQRNKIIKQRKSIHFPLSSSSSFSSSSSASSSNQVLIRSISEYHLGNPHIFE